MTIPEKENFLIDFRFYTGLKYRKGFLFFNTIYCAPKCGFEEGKLSIFRSVCKNNTWKYETQKNAKKIWKMTKSKKKHKQHFHSLQPSVANKFFLFRGHSKNLTSEKSSKPAGFELFACFKTAIFDKQHTILWQWLRLWWNKLQVVQGVLTY